MPRRLLASSLVIASLSATGVASAIEPEITSETTAQFYDVRSPSGETIVPRRRLTSTLGVAAYDLLPSSRLSPDFARARGGSELVFRARLRYDADYGAHPGEAAAGDFDRLVPGFSRGPVDLMYGYVEGRRFFGGWFGFKLGRQYTTDALGWWSFDGATVRATTPYFFAVEALGGMEVRGGLPLSTPRWERDGVWRGDRTGYDASLYPSFQPSEVAPAMGAAVESTGFTIFHARLSYRRVYNTGESNVSSFASGLTPPMTVGGARISQERVGYALDASKAELGGLKAGFSYDLYGAKLSTLFASVDAYAGERLTLSADYDFYAPTYDGDSIWNFFAGNPMNDVALRAAWDVTDAIALSGGGNVRIAEEETSPSNPNVSPNAATDAGLYPSSGASFDGGGFVAARHHRGLNSEGLRATALFGGEGHRAGGELFAERVVFGRTSLLGRASLFDWADALRPGREATSVGVVAGLGYRVSPRARTQLEYQMDTNRLVGVRSRVVLWLTVAAR
jgi:hypothetical protein